MTSDVTGQGQGHRPRTHLAPGSRVADYVIEEQVGAGGMAVVFRARDVTLGRLAAVKVLSPLLADDIDFRVRFLRESRAIAAVDESHILPVYAAGESGGVLYIATRFVAGGDLARLLRRAGGTLTPGRAAALVAQVGGALDAAHAIGLVHRDVKPGNVLIDSVPGRPEHAYLSDFGLTKADSSMTDLTASGSFLGTPAYCPPEQIKGWAVNGRGDQYALGCVAFHLLTGCVPFPRTNTLATLYAHVNEPPPQASAILAGLPPALDAVLARALAKRPEARYASCGEFAAALHEALSPAPPWAAHQEPTLAGGNPGRGPSTPEGGQPVPARGRARRGAHAKPRKVRGIIAVSVVAVLAAATWGGITLASHGHRTPAAPVTPPKAHLAATLTAPGGANFSVVATLSADGKYLAAPGTGTKESSIYIWNVTTGKYVKTISLPGKGVFVLPEAFSLDDKALVVGARESAGTVHQLYRVTLATGQRTHLTDYPSIINGAVSTDTSTFAFMNAAGTSITMTSLSGGTSPLPSLKVPKETWVPNSLRLDSSGNTLLISDAKGTAYVFDTGTGEFSTLRYQVPATGDAVDSSSKPTLSPDGKTVLIPVANDGWEEWFLSSPGATPTNVTPHDSRWPHKDGAFMFSSDSNAIFTDSFDGPYFDLWDENTRAHTARFSADGGDSVYNAFLGPDGRKVLLGVYTGGGLEYRKMFVLDTPHN